MKAYVIIFLSFFLSESLFAQDVDFASIQYGIGFSNARNREPYTTAIIKTNPVVGRHVQGNIGYRIANVQISIGLSYLTTGYERDLSSSDAASLGLRQGPLYEYFTHLTLPFSIGYRFRFGEKLAVVPAVGVELSYNLARQQHTNDSTSNQKGEEFRKNYSSSNFFASAQIGIEYRFSRKLSLVAGPEAIYTITDIVHKRGNATYYPDENNYAYLFNAGIKWDFATRKTQKGNKKSLMSTEQTEQKKTKQ